MSANIKIGVLASGGGTNLQSLIDNCEAGNIDGAIAVVISDVPQAGCLERARDHGIDAVHVPVAKTGTPQWEQDNGRIIEVLQAHGVDLVAMAGYMRKITPRLVQTFPGAAINIHPALLPSFPGTHGQRDANDYGVKLAGVTVHFADEEFDSGPIIIQGAVPVLSGDTEDSLRDRILKVEHKVYPQAVQWFAQGRLTISGRRVLLDGEPVAGSQELVWPPMEMV